MGVKESSEKVSKAADKGTYDPSVIPPDFKGRVLNCLLRAHNDTIIMQQSKFGGERPDTVFFQYPGFCNREREEVNTFHLT